jgi:membrane fusion protein, multidrug efflux system
MLESATLNRFSWRNPRVTIPAIAALAILLVFGWRWRNGSAQPAATPVTPPGIPAEIAVAARADVPVYLEGLGTVQAYFTVTITARVDGQLDKIAFTEGQTVRQGDLLAQIDPRPYQAALEQMIAAKDKDVAQLGSATSDLERYRILAPKNLTSKQQLDSQQALVAQLMAQIKGDQAGIENARTQLGYTSIRSPIAGITGIRHVDPGNIVRAADTSGIVVVTQIEPISCIFTLPEDALPRVMSALQAGPVIVIAVSRDDRTELDRGSVALVDNQIDPATGTIRLKATFQNSHHALWPGEYINARVLVHTEHDALTVPTAAIQHGPDGAFAYVVGNDATVAARPVQVGGESGALTIVTGGLRDGERIVTSNHYRLQPGAHIRIVTVSGATGNPAVAKVKRDSLR